MRASVDWRATIASIDDARERAREATAATAVCLMVALTMRPRRQSSAHSHFWGPSPGLHLHVAALTSTFGTRAQPMAPDWHSHWA
eukprot:12855071-Alexandrium_andersonii.AAC.1